MNTIIVEFVPAPGGRGSFLAEFITIDEAKRCAQAWLETADAYQSKVWDGVNWTVYT